MLLNYLVQHEVEREYRTETWAHAPMPLGPALAADFPQVERIVQVREPSDIEVITAQMDRYVPVQNAADPDWPIRSFTCC